MIFLSFVDFKSASKQNCIYKLSSDDKLLSSLITQTFRLCTFLNHSKETNEQQLCALFQQNRLCCYSFLYRTSLTEVKEGSNLIAIFFY